MTMDKQAQWQGYFEECLRQAEREGIDPLELLDKCWADGKRHAERFVLPYVSEDSVVLEIAAGIGRVSRFVAPRCRHLTCTDILDECMVELRKNLAAFDNVRVEKTNGYDLTAFPDESFDCVYAFTAFFHLDLELVVNYFAEIARVLKPQGLGILEFKEMRTQRNLDQLLDKLGREAGLARYEKKLDKWRYVALEMLELLCWHNGLDIVDHRVHCFTFAKRSPASQRLHLQYSGSV